MRFIFLFLRLLALFTLCLSAGAATTQESGIAVIVASGTAQPKISREELALIFKRKRRFWENGQHILPVNLSANHPLRRSVSIQIFENGPEELDDYWRNMYFQGVLPPYVLASEEAVIRFVASTPGAIGYISRCLVDHRVSVVMSLDDNSPCPR